MDARVQRLKDRLKVDRYRICAEKAQLIVESLQRTEGEPQIVRRAKATAHYLDNRTIFIEDDELILGNVASCPMGMEAGSMGPAWPDEDLEDLKNGALSPAQARDTHGPTAIIRSALAINQAPYQAALLNLKFHPSSLKSIEDLKKLSQLIKIYFNGGGKHIQFNVVDMQTLIDAQNRPELHRDLVVRVAGYSAYFVHLTKAVQDEIILRTENEKPNLESF
jgi:pyruvate-formate lyase